MAAVVSTSLVASAIVGAVVSAAPAAQAADQITQQTGFNGRAWSVSAPDADGTRYVGGDFTSYRAWNTGRAGVVTSATGAVDPSYPQVSGWPQANVAIPDGSGGWYIGGGISTVGATSVSKLAHINADGSVDASWTPAVTGGQAVYSLAKVGTALLVGGWFSGVNGTPRNNIAAISTTDGSLLSWNPGANSAVRSIEVVGDTAYVGGNFSSIAGETRGLAAALRLGDRTSPATGTCLSNWDSADCLGAFDPSVGGWGVLGIATSGSDVYLGGPYSTVGGTTRTGLARVDATTGTLDTTWNPVLDSQVEAVALSGTRLYVGGLFSTVDSASHNAVAAFDVSGSTPTLEAWNPGVAGGGVHTLAAASGTLYLGGTFSSVGGQVRNRAAAVDAAGSVTAWDPHVCDQDNGVASNVYGIGVSSTQQYLLGDFSCLGGQKRIHVAAVAADGVLTSWAPAVNGPVFGVARQGASTYLVGNFTAVNGTSRTFAAAVDASGSLLSWAPTLNDRPVAVIATASKVYLGGWFNTVNSTARTALAVVDPTTAALDTSFDAQLNGAVRTMTLDGSSLYVGGDFSEASGTSHGYVAKLSASTGAADNGFTAYTETGNKIWPFLESIAVIGNRLYLGGYFGKINGQDRSYLGAVNKATGALDPTWNPGSSNWVFAMTPATDDSVLYVGSNSGSIGGAVGAAAVDPVSGAVTSWRADTGEVRGISVSDAAVYLAGSFGTVGGQPRQSTAAVSTAGTVMAPWPGDAALSKTLSVAVTGGANGAVTSSPGGIDCGSSCTYAYPTGSDVTLTATPASGKSFTGWGGACSGSATTCTVALSADRSVSATFGSGSGGGGGGGSTGGSSSSSASSSGSTSAPGTPRSLTAVPGDGKVALVWLPPASPGSSSDLTYEVTAQPGGATCVTTTLSCVITGLANGTTYTFSIRAKGSTGWSGASAPVASAPAAAAVSVRILRMPRTKATGPRTRLSAVGVTTGLTVGTAMRPFVKIGTAKRFVPARGSVKVRADGAVVWSRTVFRGKRAAVYLVAPDGTRSNTLIWKAARR
jgi:hypothetical protein